MAICRDKYGQYSTLEYAFIHNAHLTDTQVQIEQNTKSSWYTVQEAAQKIKELLDKNDSASIKVTIQGPTVPYVNLYDLPDKPSLYDHYIAQDPHAILIAIYDTTQPLNETSAAKVSQQYDPFGRRTMGLLTQGEVEEMPPFGLGHLVMDEQRSLRSHDGGDSSNRRPRYQLAFQQSRRCTLLWYFHSRPTRPNILSNPSTSRSTSFSIFSHERCRVDKAK